MISDLYDAMVNAFLAYQCPVPIFLGEQYRYQHTAPTRVVMWQGKDSPPDQFLPQNAASVTPTQALQYINPRPVLTRRCGFSLELWASAPPQRDPADQFRANQSWLDALVNMVGATLNQISSGVFTIQGGLAAEGNGDASIGGLGYTALCTCDIPIIEAPWPAEALNQCSKTWAYGSAEAEISVRMQNGYKPPTFAPPSPPTFSTKPEV